ncbi:hypothetical protein CEXT_482811 [Caerostris extrusa]|uniref:Uncharacterized protein n=1 Tax=Caerostris extrusa TaxID=172846 RepID=A0AAV4VVS4_CAEEX|nr:hypothetical protein CEXT_482811 [Caerostris extrusa]
MKTRLPILHPARPGLAATIPRTETPCPKHGIISLSGAILQDNYRKRRRTLHFKSHAHTKENSFQNQQSEKRSTTKSSPEGNPSMHRQKPHHLSPLNI